MRDASTRLQLLLQMRLLLQRQRDSARSPGAFRRCAPHANWRGQTRRRKVGGTCADACASLRERERRRRLQTGGEWGAGSRALDARGKLQRADNPMARLRSAECKERRKSPGCAERSAREGADWRGAYVSACARGMVCRRVRDCAASGLRRARRARQRRAAGRADGTAQRCLSARSSPISSAQRER